MQLDPAHEGSKFKIPGEEWWGTKGREKTKWQRRYTDYNVIVSGYDPALADSGGA